MKSTEFLQAAIDVQAERGVTYDKPSGERSMGATVTAFNAITGRDLSEAEGWLLLQTLKDVRQWQNPSKYHHDSALDGVAYSALKAEALSEETHFDPLSMPIIKLKTASDIPSWDNAPEWANWVGSDVDGWYWFSSEPFAKCEGVWFGGRYEEADQEGFVDQDDESLPLAKYPRPITQK